MARDNVIEAWFAPDSEGCLIPGCGKIKVEDIRSGKEKALWNISNPASSDHIYLQSRISSSQDYPWEFIICKEKLKLPGFDRKAFNLFWIYHWKFQMGEYILQISGTNSINRRSWLLNDNWFIHTSSRIPSKFEDLRYFIPNSFEIEDLRYFIVHRSYFIAHRSILRFRYKITSIVLSQLNFYRCTFLLNSL